MIPEFAIVELICCAEFPVIGIIKPIQPSHRICFQFFGIVHHLERGRNSSNEILPDVVRQKQDIIVVFLLDGDRRNKTELVSPYQRWTEQQDNDNKKIASIINHGTTTTSPLSRRMFCSRRFPSMTSSYWKGKMIVSFFPCR